MAAPAASDIPMQIAQTIQDAHLNRAPSAAHDINPSTAADTREPVRLVVEDGDSDDDDDIPVSVLRPQPRGGRHFSHLPPIPDLRFEQSYLHSIKDAKSWWMVAWITTRDQLMMPLVQGVVYNIVLCGWQHWNRNAQLSGNSIGARVRRWWYGVNNWSIPKKPANKEKWF